MYQPTTRLLCKTEIWSTKGYANAYCLSSQGKLCLVPWISCVVQFHENLFLLFCFLSPLHLRGIAEIFPEKKTHREFPTCQVEGWNPENRNLGFSLRRNCHLSVDHVQMSRVGSDVLEARKHCFSIPRHEVYLRLFRHPLNHWFPRPLVLLHQFLPPSRSLKRQTRNSRFIFAEYEFLRRHFAHPINIAVPWVLANRFPNSVPVSQMRPYGAD